MNDLGREGGLTLNVWEYSHMSLGMGKMIVDLDKKEKEFRDSIIKVKGLDTGVIEESLEQPMDIWIKQQQKKSKRSAS